AGALITPSVWDILIRCGAAGMVALLQKKKVLPRTLVVLAALGDQEGVRACLDEPQGADRDAVNYAFLSACQFKRETVAAMLLDDQHQAFQADLIGQLAGANRETFIRTVLERSPALLRSSSPPPSMALIWAFDVGHAHLAPLLTRIWPLPDDLPHAAAIGDLD